jgi:hypothetical protein
MERIRCGIFSALTNMPFRAGKLATERAVAQTFDRNPCLCLVFFSERYASPALLDGIIQRVSPEVVVGCSTNGEIAYGYRRESVNAVALSSEYLRFGIAAEANENLIDPTKGYYQKLYQEALFDLRNKVVHHKSRLLVPEKREKITPDFGIVFLPGTDQDLDPKANEVINELRKIVGDMPLIGGTVGDDCKYEQGYIICKDEFLVNHTALILCRSDLKYSMAQKHGYHIKTNFMLNKAKRNNLQLLNGRPASEAYFDTLNIPIVEISDLRDDICSHNPLGLRDRQEENIQILFPMSRGKQAKELMVSQIIPEGTELFLMEADLEESKKASLESIKTAYSTSTIRDPRVGIIFSCVGRSTFYYERAIEEINEIKKRFKYTDISGAYFYGTLVGKSSWLSEGTTATLLIGNDLSERHLQMRKAKRKS